MTETEKRRTMLLDQTRKMYTDKNMPPAIHPRYTGTYKSIYKEDTNKNRKRQKGSLRIRFLIAFLLFGLFTLLYMKETTMTEKMVAQIQRELSSFVDLNSFR